MIMYLPRDRCCHVNRLRNWRSNVLSTTNYAKVSTEQNMSPQNMFPQNYRVNFSKKYLHKNIASISPFQNIGTKFVGQFSPENTRTFWSISVWDHPGSCPVSCRSVYNHDNHNNNVSSKSDSLTFTTSPCLHCCVVFT